MTGPYDGDEPYNLADALAAYDVDGDGYADLASDLRGTDNGNIRIYHGSSTGLAAAATTNSTTTTRPRSPSGTSTATITSI